MTTFGIIHALLAEGAGRYWTSAAIPAPFEHLNSDQGLSQNTVYCTIQDRRGFLWFGTEDGLNRYDGNRFLVFRHDANHTDSLGGNWVTCLKEDENGLLWIGTMDGGLSRMDLRTFAVQRCHLMDAPSGLVAKGIQCMEEDSKGNLWIGTANAGLYVIPKESRSETVPRYHSVTAFQKQMHALPNNTVDSIFCDRQGRIWIGCIRSGLCQVHATQDLSHFEFEPFGSSSKNASNSSPTDVLSIAEDIMGVLWLGSNQGLYRFHPEGRTFSSFSSAIKTPRAEGTPIVRRIYLDRANTLWVGTDGHGLSKMLPRNAYDDPPRFEQFINDPNAPHSLSSNAIESLYEDRSGVLWIGTFYRGLNKLILHANGSSDRERSPLIRYRNTPTDASSLSGNLVNAVLEDHRGNLWIGTDGHGLNRISTPKGSDEPLRFEHFRADPKRPGSLPDDVITCLYEDSQHRIWMGTFTHGLVRIDVPDPPSMAPTFTEYKHQNRGVYGPGSDFVVAIHEDQAHRLWIGSVDGELDLFDPSTGRFTPFHEDPMIESGANAGGSVYSILHDGYGTLWLATYDGLARFNPSKQEFRVYRPNDAQRPFIHSMVETLYIDRSNTLWVGTKGSGLARAQLQPWDGPELQFAHYTKEDGLPSDLVECILEDQRGNLWIGTTRGMCRFDPTAQGKPTFALQRDLLHTEFVRNSAIRCRSGELLFGTTEGLVLFHPDRLVQNPYVPPVMLTDLKIFNKSVPIQRSGERSILAQSISECSEIVLSHEDSVISLEFSALHFVAPVKNEYAYMMEGVDKDWNFIGNLHSVTYTTLPPGNYLFRFKGSNNDGVWNEDGARLRIRVLPPWWKTWWFRVLSLLGVTSLLLLALRWRMHALNARNLELELRVQQRTEALENANLKLLEMDKLKESTAAMLVHDLRSPLTSIGVVMDLFEAEGALDLGLLDRCRHSIKNMVTMLNDLLEIFRSSGTEIPLDLKHVVPIALAWEVRTAYQTQCEKKGVRLEVRVPGDLPSFEADEHKVERAISNLVGNALKYTPEGGTISIVGGEVIGQGVETGLRWLTLRVEDSGRGIAPEELPYIFDPYRQTTRRDSNLGVGLGLAIVQRIMAAHKGRVTVRSQVGVGTVFTLFFPIQDRHSHE